MIEKEIWLDIYEYKGSYKVSNFGRIKSIERVVVGRWERNRIIPEKILKQKNNSTGYLSVDLSMNGVKKSHNVHRLVANSFLGFSDLAVNHKNGNKKDNRIENLEFVTYSENMLHAASTGLVKSGEYSHKAKLTMIQVNEIRSKYIPHIYTSYMLASEYGLCQRSIMDIIHLKSYK